MVYITRKEHFSASHRLFNSAWSYEKNVEVFGKCAWENGHGHNYELEVTVAGNPPHDTGMVIDLKKLSEIITTEIIDVVDHKHMNFDIEFLKGVIPTAENIAVAFWRILEGKIQGGKLYSIKLYESASNFVEYRGE